MTEPVRSPDELRAMFGANLRLLASAYPSVSELTRQLGINRTQFNRYLTGESFPRPDVLDRICRFFDVDARIILEPVDALPRHEAVLNGEFLGPFLGPAVTNMPGEMFPDGFYSFSRRSFLDESAFVIGLVYVFRDRGTAYVRGYEPRDAMARQGLGTDLHGREYRGYVSRHDDGVLMVISRRNAMTCSLNFLARATSFENNHWVGYCTRTVREATDSTRATRMVFEHLGRDTGAILATARRRGIHPEEALLPLHRRLLKVQIPFR
ncbi:MAG: helix-turn-helix transcriptional regulator [Pseudomonadota bacterium]|nr:helix-turn-helix transcriptional regulator [Pseudomonadota bacterium]